MSLNKQRDAHTAHVIHTQLNSASRCNETFCVVCEDMTWLPSVLLAGCSLSAYDASCGAQITLLREKLAKEQQRARAAEAALAAQHQMQQLLQSAVQAVLLARSGAQVITHASCTSTCVTLSARMHEWYVPIVSHHMNTSLP